MATVRQTLEQKRAAMAWEHIDEVDKADASTQEKYATLAKKLPAMIQINGLGVTLAFLLAKGKEEHKLIYNHVAKWVCAYLSIERPDDFDDLLDRVRKQKPELLNVVRQESMNTYRRATVEAIEYGIWIKRYVEAKDW